MALAVWRPVGAIRRDWSAQEIACAQTVGVELAADPEPGSLGYVKRLAWLADVVVTGTVSEIRHDLKGPYFTLADIDVLTVLKGGEAPPGSLTVALMSGPAYSPTDGKIVQSHVVHEPTFAKDEWVLLFLTQGTRESGPVQSYELAADWYRVVNQSKFTIEGGTATLHGWGTGDYRLKACVTDIAAVVQAQSTKCQPRPTMPAWTESGSSSP